MGHQTTADNEDSVKILLVDAMIYNGYLTNHVIHVPTDDAAPEGEVTGIQGQHRKQFLHVIFSLL